MHFAVIGIPVIYINVLCTKLVVRPPQAQLGKRVQSACVKRWKNSRLVPAIGGAGHMRVCAGFQVTLNCHIAWKKIQSFETITLKGFKRETLNLNSYMFFFPWSISYHHRCYLRNGRVKPRHDTLSRFSRKICNWKCSCHEKYLQMRFTFLRTSKVERFGTSLGWYTN